MKKQIFGLLVCIFNLKSIRIGKFLEKKEKSEIRITQFRGFPVVDKNTNIKTLINKTSKINNIYITYIIETFGGAENFEVLHKEVNCNFIFDIRKNYLCSRLKNERDRI